MSTCAYVDACKLYAPTSLAGLVLSFRARKRLVFLGFLEQNMLLKGLRKALTSSWNLGR